MTPRLPSAAGLVLVACLLSSPAPAAAAQLSWYGDDSKQATSTKPAEVAVSFVPSYAELIFPL